MPETLQSPSCVLLYGRVVEDLTLAPDPHQGLVQPPYLGANLFLRNQLRADGAQLARIYAFSYEGHYYDLARPAILLVHGDGQRADRLPEGRDPRVSKAPDQADRIGVAATGSAQPEDIRVWAYDKGDFSLRMDVRTGPLEQILLEAELTGDALRTFFGGAQARLRRTPGDTGD